MPQNNSKSNVVSFSTNSDSEKEKSGMDQIRIQGGYALNGDIEISGAKNAALKLACACLLTDEALTLTNCPNTLRDMRSLYDLLKHIGVEITEDADTAKFHAASIKDETAPYDLVRKMRASIMVLGPLLARHGKARVSLPGGCAIGTRPVNFHIDGLVAMGAKIELNEGYIEAEAEGGLAGGTYTFPRVSHTGTENLMMAATLAKGKTVLKNAAKEPEVVDLADCLRAMGAKIEGDGTDTITIEGVEKLHGATHSVLPDRIETGTFLIAVALTGGELRLKKTNLKSLAALIAQLKDAGVDIVEEGEDVIVKRCGKNRLKGVDIMTEAYPGFPTDMQAQFMTMLCLAEGAGMVTETIFENRFMHVPELCRMGANITVQGNSAIIRGVDGLKGAEVMATDLRASVALVLAGLAAEGETVVNRIYHLDRGYENLVKKLSNVGAKITRE
jgi:UDP-N-acetylglucosamine 1-carboxyvinyltransferase